MKILHYALGFYPYRTGGMTKYVMDVTKEQVRLGNQVGLLWPGQMRIFSKKAIITTRKEIEGVCSYELINPLPVPLLEGIEDVASYIQKCDASPYKEFLIRENFDVIHIHTFMGLHKEFLEVAKELGIPTIYTTHDYYGLCPKVNLLHGEKVCSEGMKSGNCQECNRGSLSAKKIYILQSPIYRIVKDSSLVKKLRVKYKNLRKSEESVTVNVEHRDMQLQDIENDIGQDDKKHIREPKYRELEIYYEDCFQFIGKIHYNSNLAKEVFQSLGITNKSQVIPISHAQMKDHRIRKAYDENKPLALLYLGPIATYKGYYYMKKILDEIYQSESKNFRLHLYQNVEQVEPYMSIHEPYHYEEIDKVFEGIDLLLVPSMWKETFGFIVGEGLSHGVPVMVSDMVGAKDILKHGVTGYCYSLETTEFGNKISELVNNREELRMMNEEIMGSEYTFDFSSHVTTIMKWYID